MRIISVYVIVYERLYLRSFKLTHIRANSIDNETSSFFSLIVEKLIFFLLKSEKVLRETGKCINAMHDTLYFFIIIIHSQANT